MERQDQMEDELLRSIGKIDIEYAKLNSQLDQIKESADIARFKDQFSRKIKELTESIEFNKENIRLGESLEVEKISLATFNNNLALAQHELDKINGLLMAADKKLAELKSVVSTTISVPSNPPVAKRVTELKLGRARLASSGTQPSSIVIGRKDSSAPISSPPYTPGQKIIRGDSAPLSIEKSTTSKPTIKSPIQSALEIITKMTQSFEKKEIEIDKAAQEIAFAIFQADRDMHILLMREKEKRFGIRGSQAPLLQNGLAIQNGLLIPTQQEFEDCKKIKEELKFFSDTAQEMIGKDTNNLSKFITQSLSDSDQKLKEKKLQMWLKVLKILDLNHDYEALATLYYGIVGAFPIKTVPVQGGPSEYVLMREGDQEFIDEKTFQSLMSYRKLIERGGADDNFLPTIVNNIQKGEYVIPSFHTFNVPALYQTEQFKRTLNLITPIQPVDQTKEDQVKKQQDDIEGRKRTVQRLGVQAIATTYKGKENTLNLIVKMETSETRLPDVMILREKTLLSKEETRILNAPPQPINVSTVSVDRKGSLPIMHANPIVEIENKIKQTLTLRDMVTEQLKSSKDEKAMLGLQKQFFEINTRLAGFEKDKFKLLAQDDFTKQAESLKNQEYYLKTALELAKGLESHEKSYTKDVLALTKELTKRENNYLLFLESRSAYNFEASLSNKNTDMINIMIKELNKNTELLLSKFAESRDSDEAGRYITNLNNQIMKINGYANYLKSRKDPEQLPQKIETDRQNLQFAKDVLSLKERFERLMERRTVVPPTMSGDEFKTEIAKINQQAEDVLNNIRKDLGDNAHKSKHVMASKLLEITKGCQSQLAPPPILSEVKLHQTQHQGQSKS